MLITLEGGEGGGKTTVARHLAESLGLLGLDVLALRQPGGTPEAEAMRRIFLEMEPAPVAAELLISAACSDLVEKTLRPALDAGKTVICDRYVDSQYAYRVWGEGVSVRECREILDMIDFPVPAITFLLDCDPEIAFARFTGQRGLDRMEKKGLAFHRRVREGFFAIAAANPHRIAIVDASQDLDHVTESIWETLRLRELIPAEWTYAHLREVRSYTRLAA